MKFFIQWGIALLLTFVTANAQVAKMQTPKDALNFLIVGDWGRNGEFNQKNVAKVMDSAATKLDADFVISVGDNFYPNGVASVNDPHWRVSFEDIYTAHSLQTNWFVVLGNHDYRGNPQAQIDYSKISRRWNMPARQFVKKFTLENGSVVEFFFIDTNPLIHDYHEDYEKYRIADQDTNAIYRWIDSSLQASKATWKFVVGHHPFYSGGKRPIQKELVAKLAPMLDKHKVDAYFCGHEHDLQIIKRNAFTQFISGAGSEIRPTGKTEGTLYAESTHGFMTCSLTDKEALFQVLDYKGSIRFTHKLQK